MANSKAQTHKMNGMMKNVCPFPANIHAHKVSTKV